MSFGQQSGPPASPKQIAYLKVLLDKAGYGDFRSARQALGLTQRQAGGKFTSKEASALIDRLVGNEPTEAPPVIGRAAAVEAEATAETDALGRSRAELVRGMPAELLATELERRGWIVIPPV
ncbi:MAG: hypothetical protein NTZ21_07250 [Actinobacteria bacterium]|nr:hypothetical protein [Actinomycetota bacterium]